MNNIGRRGTFITIYIVVALVLFFIGSFLVAYLQDRTDRSYIWVTFSAGAAGELEYSVRVPRYQGNENNPSIEYEITLDERTFSMAGHNFFGWVLPEEFGSKKIFPGENLPSGFYSDVTLTADWGRHDRDFFSNTGVFDKTAFEERLLANPDDSAAKTIHVPDFWSLGNPSRNIVTNMFDGVEGVEFITLPTTITSISSEAFVDLSDLLWTNVPMNAVSVQPSSFNGTGIFHLSIPKTHPRGCAVRGEDYTGSSVLPVSTGHPMFAFSNGALYNNSLSTLIRMIARRTHFIVPNSVNTISDNAFESSVIETIEIPNSVTSIGSRAFWNAENLERVVLPSYVTEIRAGTFEGATSLREVILPRGLTQILVTAFRNTALESIIIYENVALIESTAFQGCSAQMQIRLYRRVPASITSPAVTHANMSGIHDWNNAGRVDVREA